MMRRNKGFTLIELMIVVAIIAIIAAIAIPSLLNAKISANEANAIGSLRTLSTACEQYRSKQVPKSYPANLSDLTTDGYVDDALASGSKNGYDYSFSGGTNTFAVTATADVQDQTGVRSFYVDQSGLIRMASDENVNNASDPLE